MTFDTSVRNITSKQKLIHERKGILTVQKKVLMVKCMAKLRKAYSNATSKDEKKKAKTYIYDMCHCHSILIIT